MSCVRFPQDMSPCWAPRRVGSIGDEIYYDTMATQKKPKLDEIKQLEGKRPLSDSDSETEPFTFTASSKTTHFPTFIVIESKDPSNPVTKLSPFVIEKQLHGILGTPKSVKKLKNNTILVQCFTRQQSENLLKNKKIFQQNVNIYPHKTLNSCKGIVRCKDLSLCSIAEIEDGLKSQGVSSVTRISVKRNGELRTTNTYILTFSSAILPESVKIGYISAKVEIYIPNPLRCFKCQQYGHHISRCPRNPVCAKCGTEEENHDFETCSNPQKCANCKGPHPAFSRECPLWKEEKEILNLKYTKNLSFPEARQLIKQRRADQTKFSSASYADVTTPTKEDCQTCTILAKLIITKFPDMAKDLKDILPKSTFAALTSVKPSFTTEKITSPPASSASVTKSSSDANTKPNKPKSANRTEDAHKTLSQQRTRVQQGKDGLPSASTYNKKKSDDEEIFETRVSDSEVSKLVDSDRSLPGKKKNRKARERKITVKIGQPSVSLSNKYDKLQDMSDETCPEENKGEEKMEEEESDGSESESAWAYHRSEWNKDLESWQTSTAETKIVQKTHM